MKFSCDKAVLSAAVSNVSRAVTTRTALQALEGILIRAEGDTLGLGLVRTMVREKLNGELTIQSDKGGTTVVFDFIA